MKNKRNRWVIMAFILIFIAMLGLKLFAEKQQQKVKPASLHPISQSLLPNQKRNRF